MGNWGVSRCTGAGLVVDIDRIRKSNSQKSVRHQRNAPLTRKLGKFVNIEETLSFYFTETLESQRLPTKFKDSVANSENGGNINRVQP